MGGHQSAQIETGKPLFILGRNGSGKSALVHSLNQKLRPNVVYIPGSRPSYFDNESLSMTPATRRQFDQNNNSWEISPDYRWRIFSGTSRNEKAIHDLQSLEVQYKVDAANDVMINGASSSAIELLQSHSSPLDIMNHLFEKATIPVRLKLVRNELSAEINASTFSIAKMSDGERAALILAADVISANGGTIFLIDEPELHLHRSIVVPLIKSLITHRSDCYFIISTHELDLPVEVEGAQVLMVRGAQWQNGVVSNWDIDLLPPNSEIPEDLRVDIIGSRRTILFVEGGTTSLDQPLYALLFPNISVRFRSSCIDVRRAVAGLRAVPSLHQVRAFGLVDNDSMPNKEILDLQSEGVFALSIFSVESLYYSSEVLTAVAAQQTQNLGLDQNDLISAAIAAGMTALRRTGVNAHLASRLAERRMRDLVLAKLPRRDELLTNDHEKLTIEIVSPMNTEMARINTLINDDKLHDVIALYPVRESGILDALAKALRFQGRSDYELAALVQIGKNEELKAVMRGKLQNLAMELDA